MKSLRLIAAFMALVIVAGCAKSESFLRGRVVRLFGEKSMCSGEQIRVGKKDFVLTAAHCIVLSKDGKTISARLDQGPARELKIIAEDPSSDLLLLEGWPNLRRMDIAKSVREHEHIRTITHGHNHDTYKTEGEIIETSLVEIPVGVVSTPEEEIACLSAPKFQIATVETFFGPISFCIMSVVETGITALIVPGSSGGMVVNDKGELVGVVSAGDGVFGLIVTLADIHAFLAKVAK